MNKILDYKVVITPKVEQNSNGTKKVYSTSISYESFGEAVVSYQKYFEENIKSQEYDNIELFRTELVKIEIGLTFGEALELMKQGKKLTRKGWKNPNFWYEIQTPDEHSKMTLPYIYMVKNENKFPTDPSCESILANDWYVVE